MKKIILVLFISLYAFLCHAQQRTDGPWPGNIEEMPEFPGGEDSLIAYLHKNLHPPTKGEAKDIYGTVFVKFTIDTIGRISDVSAIKTKNMPILFVDEAIRVVKAMPAWTPYKQEGKPTRTVYNLPVRNLPPKTE